MRYGNKTRLPAQVSLWGKPDGPWWETYKQRSVGFVSVTVSNDSVAHVKGAWTQIFASISSDVDFISINGQISGSNLDTATLLDVGVGASGSEVIIAENVAVGGFSNYQVVIPVAIPSGSRIAFRTQGVVASRNNLFRTQLFDTGAYDLAPTAVDVLGSDPATSTGTVTTNNVFNEVVSATANPYRALVIVPSLSSSGAANANPLLQLATGASGSEIVVGSATIDITSVEELSSRLVPYSIIGGFIPAGTRLSVRTSTQGGNLDVCLIGVPW